MVQMIWLDPDYAKKYATANKEKINLRTKNYYRSNPEKMLFMIAKKRAQKYNHEFTISLIDIVIPKECPVFNQPFVFNTPYAMSLDRINSSKGYIPGNIQVISRKANVMKNNATQEQLNLFAKWVLNG